MNELLYFFISLQKPDFIINLQYISVHNRHISSAHRLMWLVATTQYISVEIESLSEENILDCGSPELPGFEYCRKSSTPLLRKFVGTRNMEKCLCVWICMAFLHKSHCSGHQDLLFVIFIVDRTGHFLKVKFKAM